MSTAHPNSAQGETIARASDTPEEQQTVSQGEQVRNAFPERRGDWMQTFTGRRFWPIDPRPEDVCIEDIAHALSLQTRYGGHCLRFYSVAEHCVHLARAANREHALWLLLHDGSEGYVSDMVRPLKRHMPEYRAVEDRVAWAVYERFGLDPANEPREVKILDNRILMDERAQVMRPTDEVWNYGGASEPLGVTLEFWSPERAEREFLAAFDALALGARSAAPAQSQDAAPDLEVPNGAIHNGRECMRRLTEHYKFQDQGHELSLCSEYQDAIRCFEAMAEFICSLSPAQVAPVDGGGERGPDLGAPTREPTVRQLALNYYRQIFSLDEASSLAERYVAALATTPASAGDGDLRAAGIRAGAVEEALSEGGWWKSCSGCHETVDGHETGHYPYSGLFRCYVGAGCTDCGGLGVQWEYYTDQQFTEMAADAERLDAQSQAEAAGDPTAAFWDAIHEAAVCAWNLLDGTENDASGVDQADWDALSAAMNAMAALVPKEEQPFSPSYAVPYLRAALARPAPQAPAASAERNTDWDGHILEGAIDLARDRAALAPTAKPDPAGREGIAPEDLARAICDVRGFVYEPDRMGDGSHAFYSSGEAYEEALALSNHPILAARPVAEGVAGETLERVRHVKRGTEYEVLGEAEAQVSNGESDRFGEWIGLYEGHKLVVYRCVETGKLWCRRPEEFRDGRFAPTTATATPSQGEQV